MQVYRCPACGAASEQLTATALDGRLPKPGDVIVCVVCLEPSLYVDPTSPLYLPTPEQRDILLADPHVLDARRRLRATRTVPAQSVGAPGSEPDLASGVDGKTPHSP